MSQRDPRVGPRLRDMQPIKARRATMSIAEPSAAEPTAEPTAETPSVAGPAGAGRAGTRPRPDGARSGRPSVDVPQMRTSAARPDRAKAAGAAPTATTVQLARGVRTHAWTGGDIVLYAGDVSAFRAVRIAATAYTESGGLELKVLEIENPAAPIVLESSPGEGSYQEMRTVLDTPGRLIELRVWVDECPTGSIELSWGVWGRPG